MTRRISLNMNTDATGEVRYVDVMKGTVGSVVGVATAKNTPVIHWDVVHKGISYSADAAIKLEVLSLDIQEAGSASGASSSGLAGGSGGGGVSLAGKKVKKGFEFLDAKEGELVEISPNWSKMNATKHTDTKIKNLHSRLGMALAAVIDSMPVYGEKDLHVVSRSGKVEIWTARDFPAKTLRLAPESTEWKDRMWSQGKSVLVKYGTQ